MKVYYPSRKLGMEYAATPPEDTYAPSSLANVALANLQEGDAIRLYRNQTLTVVKINQKQVVFRDNQGAEQPYTVDGKRWGQLLRDVYGAILGNVHGVDCGGLVKSLQRDPAYAVDRQGIHCLIDVSAAAETKKVI